MSASPFAFDPFGIFRAPLSGDVNQRIIAPWFSPSLTVNYQGDPKVEDRVVTEVASYGKQLGWLAEIVLALADDKTPPKPALDKLADAVARIEKIKAEEAGSALDQATRALDKLEKDNPQAYRGLLAARSAEAGD